MHGIPDSWYIIVGIIAMVAMWLCTVVVYVVIHMAANRHLQRMMDDFAKQSPDRCFLCSYYAHVLNTLPPDHKCDHWTKEP